MAELALQLQELQKEIGETGQAKLLAAAKKKGIAVSKEQVQRFLSTKGENQIFLPLPPSQGKTGSESYKFRYMMDLADMRTNPSKGNSAWLLLVNVYSREAFTRAVKK